MYIKRQLENQILKLSKEYSCILVTGARQVGKSTMLQKIFSNTNTISLDDFSLRRLAKTDPELFLSTHSYPIIIDEVQYAPELFPYIKIAIDKGAPPGSFILTGSQSFKLMNLSRESLAGRVAIIHLNPLSQNEIFEKNNSEFKLEFDMIKKRKYKICDVHGIYERIFNGGLPALVSGKYTNRNEYFSSYIQTFIERDISDEISGVDKFLFSDFIRACACRIAQEINIHSIAVDIGISDDTAKRWLNVLEKSEIIYFIHPFSNNLLKRTIKNKKLYFFDTGIVSYLLRYSSSEILMNDAINGAILENYIINELKKTYNNNLQEEIFYYYRDVDKNEIDLIIDYDNELHPIEIKKSTIPSPSMINNFKILDKSTRKRGNGCLLCMKETLVPIDKENYIIPIFMI